MAASHSPEEDDSGMGARIRAHDWSATPLGPVDRWPSALRMAVNLIVDSPESMYLAWGPELVFLFNDAYSPVLGSRLSHALGKTLPEVWPDAWEAVCPSVERALAGEASLHEDMPVRMARHGEDEETWWSFSYSPIRDEDGAVVGLFCITNETTEHVLRKAALDGLQTQLESTIQARTAERDLLANIVETTDVMIMVSDLDYNILAINRANADEFERIYGIKPKVGDNMLDLLAGQPEHQEQVRIGWGRGLAGDEFTFVEDYGDPDRVRPYYEVKFRTLRDASGERIGAYQFVTDVTERLREQAKLAHAQEMVRQSQKMEAVGQLTGGVAHDFNNLLTIIRSSVDLLRRPDLAEDRRKKYIDAVSDTVDRAAKLTGQLLAFARRQALKPEVFDVGERLRRVADMLDTVTGARIRVVMDLPGVPCFVRADLSQFETALVNMSVNARDAMDGDGILTVRLQCGVAMPPIRGHAGATGPFVAISMTDLGTGIAEDQITRIFDPFFTTKDIGKGTGLGLSQVFGFTKQSGGDVGVDSELGKGTTFTLYLPETEATVTRDDPVREIRPSTGGGRRVLVVEDNVDVGRFSTQVLQDLGYKTTWAANAEEALERIGESGTDYDVVFSDVVMPGMGGIALAEELRRRLPDMPVVLASGYSHVLADEGAHGFELLHKPYSAEQLSSALRRLTRRRRSSDA